MIEIRKRNDGNTAEPVLSFGDKGICGVILSDESERASLFSLLCGAECSEEWDALISCKGSVTPLESLREKIGCVPAKLALYEDMTTFELLDFVGGAKGIASDRRCRQIKEALSLLRLEMHQHKVLGKLSKYVRRRILLAAALLGNPSVIVCEEPFLGLNAAQTREMSDLLSKIGQMKPIVLLSVSADVLPLCQEVSVLSASGVHYAGSAEGYAQKLSGTVKLCLTLSKSPVAVQTALASMDGLDIVSVVEDENKITVRFAAKKDLEKTILSTCEEKGCAVRAVERLTPTVADRMDGVDAKEGQA